LRWIESAFISVNQRLNLRGFCFLLSACGWNLFAWFAWFEVFWRKMVKTVHEARAGRKSHCRIAPLCKGGSMKLTPFAPSDRPGRLIIGPKLWWFTAAFMAVALSSAAALATGSFTLVGSMSQFRRQHTATLL